MPLKHRTRRLSKNKRKTVKRGGGDDSVPATATPSTNLPSWLNWSSLTSSLSSSKQPAAAPGNTAAPVEQPVGGNKRSKKYKSRKSRKSKK